MTSNDHMTSNADIARRGYEAVRRGDVDALRDFLAPDVKWHGGDPSAEGACRNRDQVINFMRQGRRRRGGTIGELVDVVEAPDDKVVVIMRRPPENDGEEAELVANLTTFRDGKAVEMVHFADPAGALAAAGVAVP
ncbi:MAG TPA: nuclear transport factor 2 family protein [Solirubrobacteraceae bacterium]|jgi:ketosteroid isomerase-like protein|nr:nuclear transport factor 2 family protein [Solirubrobacteraceae bacterium]